MFFFNNNPAAIEQLPRNEMRELLSENFGYPFHTAEIGWYYKGSRHLFKQLDPEDDNFDKNLDTILLGTVIFCCVFEKYKNDSSPIKYPMSMEELAKACEFWEFPRIEDMVNNPRYQDIILKVGRAALEMKIPFNPQVIEKFVPSKKITLLNRFPQERFLSEEELPKTYSVADICTLV